MKRAQLIKQLDAADYAISAIRGGVCPVSIENLKRLVIMVGDLLPEVIETLKVDMVATEDDELTEE